MRRFVVILALSALIPAGCSSNERDPDSRFEHEDVPESFLRARDIEAQALKIIDKGNRMRDERRRHDHLTRAVDLLREARQLYEDEVVEHPGSAEKQETCEREMERLSDHIERVLKERPRVN